VGSLTFLADLTIAGIFFTSAFTIAPSSVALVHIADTSPIGAVVIYEALFNSLDYFEYGINYLNISPWIDEKIWQAEDDIARSGVLAIEDTAGELIINGRSFKWNLSENILDESGGLYKVDLIIRWQQAEREVTLQRIAYARFTEKK